MKTHISTATTSTPSATTYKGKVIPNIFTPMSPLMFLLAHGEKELNKRLEAYHNTNYGRA